MAETVLVIGGTGLLGTPVVRRLVGDGHRVRVLTRRAAQVRARFEPAVELVQGDVDSEAQVTAALEGCTAVHMSLDGQGDWDLERRAGERVARLAAAMKLGRISLISGASADERNAWFPMTRAKLAAEAAVKASGVPFTIYRCTIFMEVLRNFVQGGKAIVMGTQPNRWHWVAADDQASMVSRGLVLKAAENRTLFIFGPQTFTMEEALSVYLARCHPGVSIMRMPFWMLSLMAVLPGSERLRTVGLPLMKYFSRVGELGDPSETNALLGAPPTTLEAWCAAQLEAPSPAAAA